MNPKEKASEYYAHNYFDMHETNSYKELKRGFEAGVEWAKKNKEINNQKVISIIEDLIFEDISQKHYWEAVEKAKDLIKIFKQK